MSDDDDQSNSTPAGGSSSDQPNACTDPGAGTGPAADPSATDDQNASTDPTADDPNSSVDPGVCPICDAATDANCARGGFDPNTCNSTNRSGCLPDTDPEDFQFRITQADKAELIAAITGGAMGSALQAWANATGNTVGIGVSYDYFIAQTGLAGFGGGGGAAVGFYFGPNDAVGYYTSAQANFGAGTTGGDLTGQITIAAGPPEGNFAGHARSVGGSASDGIGGGAALLFSDSGPCVGASGSFSVGEGEQIFTQFSHTTIGPL